MFSLIKKRRRKRQRYKNPLSLLLHLVEAPTRRLSQLDGTIASQADKQPNAARYLAYLRLSALRNDCKNQPVAVRIRR